MTVTFTLEELSALYLDMSEQAKEARDRADRLEAKLEMAMLVIDGLTSAHADEEHAKKLDAPHTEFKPLVKSIEPVHDKTHAVPTAPVEIDNPAPVDHTQTVHEVERLTEDADPEDDGAEDVTCAVCREVLVGPCAMTGCGHVFCAGCLVPWVEDHDDDDEISCPCCRTGSHSGNPFVRARGVEELVRKWVMRRVAQGPWSGLEDYRQRDQIWIIELRSNPALARVR